MPMYYVMIDDEQSVAECSSLEYARETGKLLLDLEPLPSCFSIQDADGNHVEDIGATVGKFTAALREASRVLP